jgi:hypothetical protein
MHVFEVDEDVINGRKWVHGFFGWWVFLPVFLVGSQRWRNRGFPFSLYRRHGADVAETLQQGEVVTFHAQGSPTLVVHRLYWRTQSGWLTKGDNLANPDPHLLTKQNYAGAVIVAAIHKRTGRVRLSL